MTISQTISQRVVTDRLDWVQRMLETIRGLPLDDQETFFADNRNVWTADAYRGWLKAHPDMMDTTL